MELGKSLRQMINESSVYGDNWKFQCVESIDNEVAKAEASLKYWKGVRAKVMVAK